VRLVLDTNTAVSGLIWGGVPGRLIDAAAAGTAQIISSVPLLDELHDVLFRKKFAAQLAEQGVDAADLFEGYAALVQLVVPAGIGPVILADPDDDIVLATAVAGDAGAIVSGDAAVLTTPDGEPLQRKGRPGAVSQEEFQTLKIAGHIAVNERDPDEKRPPKSHCSLERACRPPHGRHGLGPVSKESSEPLWHRNHPIAGQAPGV